jgi:hypothetical protein
VDFTVFKLLISIAGGAVERRLTDLFRNLQDLSATPAGQIVVDEIVSCQSIQMTLYKNPFENLKHFI